MSKDAPVLSPEQIAEKARKFTVLIEGPASSGTGVIISKNKNKYKLVTAWHVLKSVRRREELTAQTAEGMHHKIRFDSIERISDVDLAVAEFNSSKQYPVAKIGRPQVSQSGMPVYVSGYPLATPAVPKQIFRTLAGTSLIFLA